MEMLPAVSASGEASGSSAWACGDLATVGIRRGWRAFRRRWRRAPTGA